MAKESDWRIDGWECGEESDPYLRFQSLDGEFKTLSLPDLYEGYDVDTFKPWENLPIPWRKIIEESLEDCQRAFGDPGWTGKYHWEKGNSPCRWRSILELAALYQHAKENKLPGVK